MAVLSSDISFYSSSDKANFLEETPTQNIEMYYNP
jgi:hypothetical protein